MAIADPQVMTRWTSRVSREVRRPGLRAARLRLRRRGLPFALGVQP